MVQDVLYLDQQLMFGLALLAAQTHSTSVVLTVCVRQLNDAARTVRWRTGGSKERVRGDNIVCPCYILTTQAKRQHSFQLDELGLGFNAGRKTGCVCVGMHEPAWPIRQTVSV